MCPWVFRCVRGQTSLGNYFSPSTFISILRIEVRSPRQACETNMLPSEPAPLRNCKMVLLPQPTASRLSCLSASTSLSFTPLLSLSSRVNITNLQGMLLRLAGFSGSKNLSWSQKLQSLPLSKHLYIDVSILAYIETYPVHCHL